MVLLAKLWLFYFLLLVVDNHLMKWFAVFIGPVHDECGGLSVSREHRFALGGSPVEVPDLLSRVTIDSLHDNRSLVSALDRDRLSSNRGVMPGSALAVGAGFVDGHRPVGIDGTLVDLRRRTGEFGLGEIHFPFAREALGRHLSLELGYDQESKNGGHERHGSHGSYDNINNLRVKLFVVLYEQHKFVCAVGARHHG